MHHTGNHYIMIVFWGYIYRTIQALCSENTFQKYISSVRLFSSLDPRVFMKNTEHHWCPVCKQ